MEPSTLPFTSDEDHTGNPPWRWENFRDPQLRKFYGSQKDIVWTEFLGRGEDGFVLQADLKNEHEERQVAVKFVSAGLSSLFCADTSSFFITSSQRLSTE
jgi:hypothetical protein